MKLKKKFSLILIIFISFSFKCYSQILIFTYSYNRPDFIELQYKTLRTFCKDKYELLVFNDAKEPEMSIKINKMCQKLGIRHIQIPQKIHDIPYLERQPGAFADYQHPSVRNCNVVQWSLDHFGFKHNDIVVLLDGDMFLTKNFSVRKFLGQNQIAAYGRPCNDSPWQHECSKEHPKIKPFKYLWIGLVFLNINSLPNKTSLNFNCGKIFNVNLDSGGHTIYYLHQNPKVKVQFFDRTRITLFDNKQLINRINQLNFRKESKKLALTLKSLKIHRNIEFYLNDTFLHYGGGTNYAGDSKEANEFKTQKCTEFINFVINANTHM